MAVARAYGVKKIIAFDIEASRVDFAANYAADIGVLCPKKSEDKPALDFATEFMEEIMKKHGLGSGVDLAIEASGSESCVQMGVILTKPGGTCKYRGLDWTENLLTFPDIQAGLGKALSAVPLFLFTAKELTMKGS